MSSCAINIQQTVEYLKMHSAICLQFDTKVLYFITRRLCKDLSKPIAIISKNEHKDQMGILQHQDQTKNDQRIKPQNSDTPEMTKPSKFPDEPTTCCMSGCANCIWLDYAEEVSAFFKDGGESAIIEIEKKVQDPNIKAFLLTELRMRLRAKVKKD